MSPCFSFRGINYVWMASHVLAMSNSCVNPFIYGIYIVRQHFAQLADPSRWFHSCTNGEIWPPRTVFFHAGKIPAWVPAEIVVVLLLEDTFEYGVDHDGERGVGGGKQQGRHTEHRRGKTGDKCINLEAFFRNLSKWWPEKPHKDFLSSSLDAIGMAYTTLKINSGLIYKILQNPTHVLRTPIGRIQSWNLPARNPWSYKGLESIHINISKNTPEGQPRQLLLLQLTLVSSLFDKVPLKLYSEFWYLRTVIRLEKLSSFSREHKSHCTNVVQKFKN